MPKIKALLVISCATIAASAFVMQTQKVHAGMARGTSTSLQIVTEGGKPGDIIVHKNGEYSLAKEAFDTEIFGVIVESSSLSLVDPIQSNGKLILQTGDAQVLVTNNNGQIKKGDFITSSTTPGVGQKADKTGYVVGKAQEDYNPADANQPGLVWATIRPQTAYINNTVKMNLLEALKSGALSPLLNPVESLRYILAALVTAATFIIGFSTFGKSSGRSIEAMGRNPLAGGSIRAALVFNMILSFGVMLVGLALAYLILVL